MGEEAATLRSRAPDSGANEPSPLWRTIRTVLGFALIGLGFLGLILPIIPGIPLAVAGLAMLGSGHPVVRRLRARLRLWRRGRAPGP